MKVFMTGGTGFVGTYLSRRLIAEGHEVTILTRRAQPPAPAACRASASRRGPHPGRPLDGGGAGGRLDHQPGRGLHLYPLDRRPQAGNLRQPLQTTRNLVIALAAGDRRQLFCSTSAVGYYGPRGEETLTEDSPADAGFLGDVAKAWEAEALKAQDLGVRTVITRFGIVLGRDGGALGQMVPLFKKFLGGPLGDG